MKIIEKKRNKISLILLSFLMVFSLVGPRMQNELIPATNQNISDENGADIEEINTEDPKAADDYTFLGKFGDLLSFSKPLSNGLRIFASVLAIGVGVYWICLAF